MCNLFVEIFKIPSDKSHRCKLAHIKTPVIDKIQTPNSDESKFSVWLNLPPLGFLALVCEIYGAAR